MFTLKEFVGASATISTVLQFFSGIFTVRKVQLQGTPGDISHVPFLAAVFSCLLWLVYGSYIDDFSVICTNMIGVSFNAFYVLVFFYFTSTEKMKIARQIALAGITFFVFLQYLRSIEDPVLSINHLGVACILVTVSTCASPLVSLKHVIATKSTESLPFPLILCIFIVSLQWWIYALLLNDTYMKITNFMGILISGAQLSLFLLYPSSSSGKSIIIGTRKI